MALRVLQNLAFLRSVNHEPTRLSPKGTGLLVSLVVYKRKPLTVVHKYTYPDSIPEFAEAESPKFRAELMKKLQKNKETFSDDCENVVCVCSEIFHDFLHKEYRGPGTLLIEPFTDMLLALKEKKL